MNTAAASGSSMAGSKCTSNGRVTSRMPANPTSTASQRPGLTRSPSTRAAATVNRIGATQTRVEAVAMGSSVRPVMKHTVAQHSQKARRPFQRE